MALININDLLHAIEMKQLLDSMPEEEREAHRANLGCLYALDEDTASSLLAIVDFIVDTPDLLRQIAETLKDIKSILERGEAL